MDFIRRICIFLLFFLPLISVGAFSEPSVLYKQDKFPVDSLFKVAIADFTSKGRAHLLLLGRDYLENQAQVYALSWNGGELVKVWESSNLLEERSPIFMAIGRPGPAANPGIIILTNHRLDIYLYKEDKFYLATQIYHSLNPHELTVADVNNDGIDELLIARVGRQTKQYYDMMVEAYQVSGDELIKMGASPLLGNIRSIVGGDLNGDGAAEVILESGAGNKSGAFYMLRWDEEKGLVQKYVHKRLLPSVVYGLATGVIGGEPVLVTADDWGRVNFFSGMNGDLKRVGAELVLKQAFVSAALGDLDGDNRTELALVGYPNHLRILTGFEENALGPTLSFKGE